MLIPLRGTVFSHIWIIELIGWFFLPKSHLDERALVLLERKSFWNSEKQLWMSFVVRVFGYKRIGRMRAFDTETEEGKPNRQTKTRQGICDTLSTWNLASVQSYWEANRNFQKIIICHTYLWRHQEQIGLILQQITLEKSYNNNIT